MPPGGWCRPGVGAARGLVPLGGWCRPGVGAARGLVPPGGWCRPGLPVGRSTAAASRTTHGIRLGASAAGKGQCYGRACTHLHLRLLRGPVQQQGPS
jgi:hypothetical protein